MESATTATAVQQEQDYILQTYVRPGFVLEHGKGMYLYDTEGRRYLDFVAGIAVNALGYGDEQIAQLMAAQAQRLIHVSNLFHTQPGSALAQQLVASSDHFSRVFFCNSGTEAMEGTIKFARKVARTYSGPHKTAFVAFEGSFHGRTMGSVALTARESYRTPFQPVMPDVRHVPFNDSAALAAAMGDDVCAVVIEPVQGEGGLRVADAAFLHTVRTLCDEHDALLILDEIQCGMGRTGTLWAHEAYDVRPDMMAIAKPLAAGLPIGAILLNDCVASAIQPGDHGTTFGGGPLITSVAQAVLERISAPEFLNHVRSVSDYLDEALHEFAAAHADIVHELRGCGLMRGLHLHEPRAAEVRMRGHDVGLLVAIAGPDVVRLLPPLIVEPAHIDEALAKLAQAL